MPADEDLVSNGGEGNDDSLIHTSEDEDEFDGHHGHHQHHGHRHHGVALAAAALPVMQGDKAAHGGYNSNSSISFRSEYRSLQK